MSVSRRPPFVGREAELARLRRQLELAARGEGSIALVAGEPGIGKTRLAEELAAVATARGDRVLWGRCWEGDGAPAFWPWVQCLRSYADDTATDRLRADLGAGPAAIAHVVAEVRARLPDLPAPPPLAPEQARFRFFDAVTGFLTVAAGRRPLLIILDDLHWADTPSLLLVQFLARALRDARILLVASYRDVEVGGRHPLAQALAELVREPFTERIQLEGLGRRAIADMVALVGGADPPPALVAAIDQRTAGNPFFVTEVVRLLTAEGRLSSAEGSLGESLTVPPSVRVAIDRRLGRLSEPCQHVLTAAAVIGRDFGLSVLERVSGLPRDDLLEALGEAESARLISRPAPTPGRYRFAHALVREARYDQLSVADRVRLHRRVGEALEQLYAPDPAPHLTELAYHFWQAAPGGDADTAVVYLRRAGDRALELLAHEEAVRHYETVLHALALQEPVDEQRRCEALLMLGDARERAGDAAAAKATFRRAADLARRLGLPEHLAQAALGVAGPRSTAGLVERPVVALLEEALSVLDEADGALRVRLLSRLAVELYYAGAPDQVEAHSGAAVAMARRLEDPTVLAYALHARHVALWGPDAMDERRALADEIIAIGEQLGDDDLTLRGRGLRVIDLFERGEMIAVEAEVARHGELSERLRQPYYRWQTLVCDATLALFAGRVEEGERLSREALAVGLPAHGFNAELSFAWQHVPHLRDQGRLKEQAAMMLGLLARLETPPVVRFRPLYTLLLALESEEMTAARRIFEQLAARDFADVPRDVFWLRVIGALCEAAEALGDDRRAALLFDLLRPYRHRIIVHAGVVVPVAGWGAAARSLGLAAAAHGRLDKAVEYLTDAVEMNERLGARPWVARTRYDLARVHLLRGARGDRASAQALLERAHAAATALGLTRLADQIERSANRRPQRPAGLSEREVEVLRLLARGRTNREIAEALVVSARTVEHHIEHIYAKIGAQRRAAAIAYALGHDLT
ncbi:MAG: ATP-binding protein [Dehalococcoidia bacterium]